MFSNLFGKKDQAESDHVFKDRAYMTIAAKMNACAALAKQDESALFIAWFSESAREFKEFFSRNGLAENRVIEAKYFTVVHLQSHTPVFIEHYPIHSKEVNFVANWKTKDILVYSAMDEPLFLHFGSDKLLPLMKMMGMKADEVIEHSMVTKSIIKGQKKIEEQVNIEQSAASQAAWMERNLK